MEKPEEKPEEPKTVETPVTETPPEEPKEDIPPEEPPKEEPVEDIEPSVREAKKEEPKEEVDEPVIDPEDEKTISRVVDKKLQTVNEKLKKIQQIEDAAEIDAYIKENPQFGKYRGSILKHVAHPAYAQIPVANIAAMVASRDLMKIGAQKEREAAAKAKETQQPGETVRKPSGTIDWSKASREEYAAHKAKVLGQG